MVHAEEFETIKIVGSYLQSHKKIISELEVSGVGFKINGY